MRNSKPKISTKPKNLLTTTSINNKSNKLIISYEYLCLDNKKYSMSEIGNPKQTVCFYNDFNNRLKEYSQYDNFKKHISDNHGYRNKHHIHPIDWNDNRIREISFTSLKADLMEQIKGDCWQLGINNQGFRIHGFFIENVFYVVWLDPLHNLYNRK